MYSGIYTGCGYLFLVGFQEVEIKSNNPAPSGTRNQKANNRKKGNNLKERVEKATEGKDTDFHNVVKNANKKNTKKNNMIPQYPVGILLHII